MRCLIRIVFLDCIYWITEIEHWSRWKHQ